jgi:hypothetical protein
MSNGSPGKGQRVDAAGAEKLRLRIEEQQHWRLAAAVADGRQPPVDPDRDALEEVRDEIRLYKPRILHGVLVHYCKRLVDGVWEHGSLEDERQTTTSTDVAGPVTNTK